MSNYYYQPVVTCVTDNTSCCSRNHGFSNWYNSSNRQVFEILPNAGGPQFQEMICSFQVGNLLNTFTQGLVLGRLLAEAMNNCSGLYHCLIPDRYGELQQLFLGIYNADIRCKYNNIIVNQHVSMEDIWLGAYMA